MKTYGGQAVMEGVMMRGQRTMAVAVRAPSGEIVLHQEPLVGRLYQSRWAKWPLVRGAVMIADTMSLGVRSLMFSANVAMAEEGEGDARKAEMPPGALWGTLIFALVAAVGLFFVLPVLVIGYLDQWIGSSVVSNLGEKVIRLALVLGYVVAIGQLPDVRRVFGYHGAEHKAINCYEAGDALTPVNVQRRSLIHPRCGTTFLVVVVLISFVLFALLGRPELPLRIASRILLVPVVAGIAYELIRYLAPRYHRSGLVRAIMAPGLAVQRLTTREPDLAMCAVAIAALAPVLRVEEGLEVPTAPDPHRAEERPAEPVPTLS